MRRESTHICGMTRSLQTDVTRHGLPARLMIKHGVGVRDRVAYVIRSVDEDYFADPEG
jgi:hypothetical protein